MVDKTISDLYTDNPITGLADGDLIEAEQSSTSGGTTFGDVFTYVQSKDFTALKLKRYTETVATGSASLDRADGGIQTFTMTADTTFTLSIATGESLLLILSGGGSWTPTWPTLTWTGGAPSAYTAEDHIEFYQVGATLYAAYVGSAA